MILNKKQGKIMEACIQRWVQEGYIDEETAGKLRKTYQISAARKAAFDWKNLSLIAFFFSIICIVLATTMLIADKWLMALLDALIDTSDTLKTLFFALLAGALYYWANLRKKKYPKQVFSNEALFMFGAVSIAFALTYLNFVLGLEKGDFPILILLATLIFGCVGVYLHSSLTWYLALLALTLWFGTETGYRSGWDTHFLGMNYPLRFSFFGLFLVSLSFLFNRFGRTKQFVRSTFAAGLIGLLLSFWLLSIFGNHGDLDTWASVGQWHFLFWAILLGVVSVGLIYYGLKKEDKIARELGIIFLLLNIYTRYFEYFWDNLHKVLFFIILAISFWIIGKKAENFWNLTEKG